MQRRVSVLIIGHGSRQQASNLEFEELVACYGRRRPEFDVSHGFIELAEPHFSDALLELAKKTDRVVLMPLFLFAAGHVKNDIPIALTTARSQFPGVRFDTTRVLGIHPTMVDLAFERACSVFQQERDEARRTAVIVVGRGSSDPDANGDFCKLVRLLGEGRDFAWVLPSFIGVTRPLFEEAIELIARVRPERILVVPYFLFAGRLMTRLQDQVRDFSKRYPWIKTELAPHLGSDERLFDLIDERVYEILEERQTPLPCDNCLYRVPVGGIVDKVGGLKSLLWSVRHTVTHNQAMPHLHAHNPLRKHVLVCGNVDCAEGGSLSLIAALRRLIKDAGHDRDICVTRTSCMGRCGEGPTVAVYPDGIWYRKMKETDADEFVREHLLGDRLVERLIDNILM